MPASKSKNPPTDLAEKECRFCGRTKPISEFNKYARAKNGWDYWCRACRKEYAAKHYQGNKRMYVDNYKRWATENRAQAVAVQSRHRTRRWVLLNSIKALLGCVRCGEKDPRCLDFHHLDEDQKVCTVSQMLCWAFDKLMAEVLKCEILCANCHRKHHGTTRKAKRIERPAKKVA